MSGYVRHLFLSVVLVMTAAAGIGYLVGSSDRRGAPKGAIETLSAANILVEYPSSWQRTAPALDIPGLSMANAVALAPRGHGARAGLIIGQLGEGEASPLPGSFMARVGQLPNTQVVNLPEIQAYKYAEVNVPGFDPKLTIYSIPTLPSGDGTVLTCYASAALVSYMRACQQIVATVTMVDQAQHYEELTPEPAYAQKLRSSLETLNKQRVAFRREMAARTTPATAQRVASRLGEAFAVAGASLSTLQPPLAVQRAQTALSDSISTAREAYAVLAVAAAENSAPRFAAARADVYGAEASVNGALERFKLLAY